jgi:hypothetical protein
MTARQASETGLHVKHPILFARNDARESVHDSKHLCGYQKDVPLAVLKCGF